MRSNSTPRIDAFSLGLSDAHGQTAADLRWLITQIANWDGSTEAEFDDTSVDSRPALHYLLAKAMQQKIDDRPTTIFGENPRSLLLVEALITYAERRQNESSLLAQTSIATRKVGRPKTRKIPTGNALQALLPGFTYKRVNRRGRPSDTRGKHGDSSIYKLTESFRERLIEEAPDTKAPLKVALTMALLFIQRAGDHLDTTPTQFRSKYNRGKAIMEEQKKAETASGDAMFEIMRNWRQ